MALGQMIGSMFGLGPQTPEAPDYEPVDLRSVMQNTMSANLGAIPRIERLAEAVNQFNTEQDIKSLEQLFPGAADRIAKAGSIIDDLMAGKMPTDARNQMLQYRREMSRAGGTGGSLFQLAGEMTDIGKSSLDAQMTGMTAAERWLAQSRSRVPLFNMASMFATPAMGLQNAQFNATNQWNVDWLQNQLAAQGDVWEQYAMQSIGQMDALAFSAMTYGLGGMMGGGGMGGMGGAFGGSEGTAMGAAQNAGAANILNRGYY